ncbi:MAG TPA: DUF4097 family beta strand repeat-containing protein [Ktedonobacteraceae bacterium]
MQNHEHIYDKPEQTSIDKHSLNTDPREQPSEEDFHAYNKGYGGPNQYDIWSEGEKLRAEPVGKSKQSVNWLLALVVLLCLIFIAIGILGAIVIWLSWLIVMLLIVLGAVAFIMNWRVVNFPMPERRFQIMEHARLELNNAAGKITIRRGEPGVIAVNATRRASGFGINPEQMQVFYDQHGDNLAVSTKVNWHIFQFGMRSIHFEITVPEGCDVQLNNGAGGIIIQGTNGSARVRTGSGKIEANDLQGQIALKTGSGGIKASNLQGQIDILTGSGGVESYSLRGQVALKTGSGSIRMYQSRLAGSSRLTTGSSKIVYEGELDPQGNVLMKTGSGGITLTLPGNSAFSLDAKTGSGGVTNDFGSREVGNGPRAQIKLKTGSGGIHIISGGVH